MINNLDQYTDYKIFLNEALLAVGKGSRTKFAAAIACQPGFITHVLSGKAHLSLEQAEKANIFFGHNEAQSHYFLNLVSLGRAGTESLKRYYRKQLDADRQRRTVLKNRLKFQKSVGLQDQATFYSSWLYSACQVAVSLPECKTELALAEYFRVPLKRINEVVSFLLNQGLILRNGNELKPGPSQVFLGTDSPMISKLHSNWRIEAIKSLDRYSEKDLHYSAAITISHKDVEKVRELMVECIEKIRSVIKPSPDEICCVYSLDLFKIGGES